MKSGMCPPVIIGPAPFAVAGWTHRMAGVFDAVFETERLPKTSQQDHQGRTRSAAACQPRTANISQGRARLGRLDEAAERAQAGLALDTRVGSGMWIARTKALIEKITAASGAPGQAAGVMHNHGSAPA
jgi:hypothetical protein